MFALARVKQDLLEELEAAGLAQRIGSELVFPTLPTAVQAYEEWRAEHPAPDAAARPPRLVRTTCTQRRHDVRTSRGAANAVRRWRHNRAHSQAPHLCQALARL